MEELRTGQADQISTEEHFLRALSRLVSDRELYPEKHPRIIADHTTLQTNLLSLFTKRPDRSFVFIEDQIFVDDRLLNNSNYLRDIINIFHQKGVDAVILRQGLTWEEFESFLYGFLFAKQEGSVKSVFHSSYIDTTVPTLVE